MDPGVRRDDGFSVNDVMQVRPLVSTLNMDPVRAPG
jgi:hypothetical protein